MKIKLKNLGAIKQAEFELGDLTIICGGNNTGKTYATYALFGFLHQWRQWLSLSIPLDKIEALLNDGTITLDIGDYLSHSEEILDNVSQRYSKQLSKIFASSPKHFEKSAFNVSFDAFPAPKKAFDRIIGTANTQLFSINKQEGSNIVIISLLLDKAQIKVSRDAIHHTIGDALEEMIFSEVLPTPFIASAERTGAAIFRKELNFARNRMLEEMGNEEMDPFELLLKTRSDYALPVKSNVEFTRKLESLTKEESFIAKNHPDILENFSDIIGGDYQVTKNDELYYSPKGKGLKLTMDESSSAVRSLLDIAFYLRHEANLGDLLMVDEPELNLHPENQRRVARLFAQLVNVGIKVFVTTHSDYLIKELNTLIMLNQKGERLARLASIEGYQDSELLNTNKVKVYIAKKDKIKPDGYQKRMLHQTLVPAKIDSKYGIEASSFDETIEEMNRIQEEIVWGD